MTEIHRPLIFEQFFELGKEEIASPFIRQHSRKWGRNLPLKASLLGAGMLLLSYLFSWQSNLVPLSQTLLLGVYFLTGIPAAIESLEELFQLDINIDMLMTLAAFSSIFIGSGMEGGLLLVLFAISGSMEEAVRTKAKSAIQSLHKLSPTRAFVIREDGSIVEKSVQEIQKGDTILVKAGQVVPLDGTVIEGISSVNLVHLTGENLPIRKEVNQTVPAGARNLEGALTIQVTHTSQDSTLARIIKLVTQAERTRPRLQRWFDRLSSTYAMTIISLALFFSLSFPYLLNIPFLGNEGSIYRALAFLIAASPCALIIAIPIAYLSAISTLARNGIVLKGGMALDALAQCQTIAFDKTGTLTTGELTCLGIIPLQESSEKEMQNALALSFALEQNAVHPIATAICRYVEEKGIRATKITDFEMIPGYGLKATFDKAELYIGHEDYLSSPKLQSLITEHKERGEMVSVLKWGEKLFLFRFTQTVRPKIQKSLETLKNRYGLDLVMLTGDHPQSAKSIADLVGISSVFAGLKPEQKLAQVSELSKKGLAMVGDGINDAPALARATVGICMGKVGSTPAMDAADIIFLHDTLDLLDWLYEKAKKTQRIVRQNLFVASGAILAASLPALLGFVPLWLAVILHEGGTVLVGLNALRLLREK